MITEVFPEALDPHSRNGRTVMKKYADVARFLEATKGSERAVFVALRVETENIESGQNPRKGIKACSVRYYQGLKAEHFSVARDDMGAPLGVRIEHPSYSKTIGWKDEPSIHNTEQTAIVDATLGTINWHNQPFTEQESMAEYVFSEDSQHIDQKLHLVDQKYGLFSTPLWGIVLDMSIEAVRRGAGLEPQDFPPIAKD